MDRGKATFLGRAPVLRRLPPSLLARIVEQAEQVRVRRRRELWSAGDPVEHIYFVRSGVVSICIDVTETHHLTLSFHGKGDIVGEVGALAAVLGRAEARQHTRAVAHEELVVYALPVSELQLVMERIPGVAVELAGLAADRRRRAEERLAMLPFRSVQARVCAALLELAESFGVRDSRGTIVNLRLTHKELATLVGSSRETVTQVLCQLREDGALESEGKRVVLLDRPGLAARADAAA